MNTEFPAHPVDGDVVWVSLAEGFWKKLRFNAVTQEWHEVGGMCVPYMPTLGKCDKITQRQ